MGGIKVEGGLRENRERDREMERERRQRKHLQNEISYMEDSKILKGTMSPSHTRSFLQLVLFVLSFIINCNVT